MTEPTAGTRRGGVNWYSCPFSVIARSEPRGSRGAAEKRKNRHSSELSDYHSSGIPALRRPAQSTCRVLDSQNLLPAAFRRAIMFGAQLARFGRFGGGSLVSGFF